MSFTAVDLSKLPLPDIVEELDFEEILAARKAKARELLTEKGLLPDWDATSESDVLVVALEEQSYRELLILQKFNEGCRAVMLATSTGTNLDNLAANFDTERLVLDPGDDTAIPPVDPTYETDASLKERTQMAFEALSTAGPEGAYIYHAKSASARVADVSVDSPTPGEVVVTILAADGDGIADDELCALVLAAMPGSDDDGVRPLTDAVTVQPGTKVDYAVEATLDLFDGPDQEVLLAASQTSIAEFTAAQRLLGVPVTIDGLHKALRVEGVKRVTLASPTEEVAGGAQEFANCTDITVAVAGEDA